VAFRNAASTAPLFLFFSSCTFHASHHCVKKLRVEAVSTSDFVENSAVVAGTEFADAAPGCGWVCLLTLALSIMTRS